MSAVRHIRSIIGASQLDYRRVQASVLPGEYQVVGYNPDRHVVIVLAVRADSTGEAVRAADEWVERNGKVRPAMWRTAPGA